MIQKARVTSGSFFTTGFAAADAVGVRAASAAASRSLSFKVGYSRTDVGGGGYGGRGGSGGLDLGDVLAGLDQIQDQAEDDGEEQHAGDHGAEAEAAVAGRLGQVV